jgi:hypothetical protein
MNTHCISLAFAFLSFFGAEFCILIYKMHKLEQLIEDKKKTTLGHYLLE